MTNQRGTNPTGELQRTPSQNDKTGNTCQVSSRMKNQLCLNQGLPALSAVNGKFKAILQLSAMYLKAT